jgi:hypothetical protein
MESGIVWVKSTLTKPNQQILKMRDGQEQYRINGIGNFGSVFLLFKLNKQIQRWLVVGFTKFGSSFSSIPAEYCT